MENILSNTILKQQFINSINYNIVKISINNLNLNSFYLFYNEKHDLLEIHSKESNQFKEFNKFWYYTKIGYIDLKSFKALKIKYEYNEKGLFSIELGFFPHYTFYINQFNEINNIDLIKPLFKDYIKSNK